MPNRTLISLICLTLLSSPVAVAQSSRARDDSPEARLARLEQQIATLRETLLDHESTLSQLQRDIQTLRGEKEVLLHTIEQVKRQQEEMFLDLDQRFRELPGSGGSGEQTAPAPSADIPDVEPLEEKSPPAKTTPPAPSTSKTSPPVKDSSTDDEEPVSPAPRKDSAAPNFGPAPVFVAPSSNDETQDYQTLFKLVQNGEYEKSIAGWEAFLKRYPQGEYVANATYWLGESQAALKQYGAAISTFKTLRDQYPDHQKSAHALLKIGYIYYEQKQYNEAKTVLKQVKELYPGTATAQLAEERLRQIYRE